MKERLLEFLKAENKSSAQLAEEIGVQPSGISHILSGRNNPSLDFVLKMLEKYQFLSSDWLLFGRGDMYKDIKMQNLFDSSKEINVNEDVKQIKNEPFKAEMEFSENIKSDQKRDSGYSISNNKPSVHKIVWFYIDNSFDEYFPRR
jgi:transcriptional regulator with XRE-family HTH domain